MTSNLHAHDLIRQLKTIRQEQNLTLQNICDMLDAANSHVSLCTVKKVFAEGSENENFRYHDTLQPIARVLLGVYGQDREDSELDALHAEIRDQEQKIQRLKKELAGAQSEHARRTEFLLKQIALKDERIDRLMSRVDVLLVQLQKLVDRCTFVRITSRKGGHRPPAHPRHSERSEESVSPMKR